ncbi:flagellar hook-basal body complex protein [Neobacillus kokaensis]|uniref:Flagellar hook protein FlgE n=1 Tax=Neobacillus kokaensis TaxID=2759023 RepID=A0ABQ3NA98_9BACI|nr:flagellar hook-basal body complex protein [Neobacillus kokaensis]GHH99985.1 flagellar basal-body rod protein FlgG [Neobacillus kokaensis]
MLRSLNSGVSGLKGFQTKLDVIGNNIANVNTVGFKKGRVVFEDIFSQTVKAASGPKTATAAAPAAGGTNPIQVGLGTRVGSIDTVHTPGSPTTTNIGTDLYLDGDGFFVVQNGTEKFLTRAGNFKLDSSNQLVNQNGMFVLDQKGNTITIPGNCISFAIDQSGEIIGVDVNGDSVPTNVNIGTVKVNNPSGLLKAGGSLYSLTPNANAGKIEDLLKNNKSDATIISGTLEMSNVDLSEELTDMITAQRGFQANAKIITVSDSILEELVNLKR